MPESCGEFASVLEFCENSRERNSVMTKYQAKQMAISLRAVGWPVVSVEKNNDGTWRAVAEDPYAREAWLTRLLRSHTPGSFMALPDRLN